MATLATVRKLALALPDVSEGTSYGTAAFRVRKKLFARLRDDDAVLVARSDFDVRDSLIETNPEVYFTTDHYRNYDWVLVRLGRIKRAELAEVLEDAWRMRAPERLLAEYDAAGD